MFKTTSHCCSEAEVCFSSSDDSYLLKQRLVDTMEGWQGWVVVVRHTWLYVARSWHGWGLG
jgi:hypothetical protein